MLLSPSILSADFSALLQDVKKIEEGGADYIHVDVMDGHFVPNISFGAPVMKSLNGKTALPAAAAALPPLPHLLTRPLLLSSLCTLFICNLFFRQWRFYAITDLNKTAFPFLCVMNSPPVSAVWSEKCSCFQC